MTSKDYTQFAKIVKSIQDDENVQTKSDTFIVLVHSLTTLFQNDNPRFDATKFKTACGYYNETRKDIR